MTVKRIDYTSVGKIDVLAAGTPAIHAELQGLLSQDEDQHI